MLDLKELVLAYHLHLDSIEEAKEYLDDYLVLTDEEADERAAEYIEDSLWAFNSDFIISECELDFSGSKSLSEMQSNSCESSNDFIKSLIKRTCGLESFIESAISADGRGHFMSSYDGEEHEYYIEDVLKHFYGDDVWDSEVNEKLDDMEYCEYYYVYRLC